MKELKAFIRPEMLNAVHNELKSAGYCCMTVTECEGTGKHSDPEEAFPSLKHPFLHAKKLKLEIVCHDAEMDDLVRIITESGRTGRNGDGLIYVSPVDGIYRIRDGRMGEAALDHDGHKGKTE